MLHFPLNLEGGNTKCWRKYCNRSRHRFYEKSRRRKYQNHENELLNYAQKRLLEIDGLKIYGEKPIEPV